MQDPAEFDGLAVTLRSDPRRDQGAPERVCVNLGEREVTVETARAGVCWLCRTSAIKFAVVKCGFSCFHPRGRNQFREVRQLNQRQAKRGKAQHTNSRGKHPRKTTGRHIGSGAAIPSTNSTPPSA